MVEDGAIEFLLGSEVAEDHRFRHARSHSNFPGSCATKTSLGKKADGDAKYLKTAILSAHAAAAYCSINNCRHQGFGVYFLTQSDLSSLK